MVKKYKISVTDDCIGCGGCEAVAPDLFKVGTSGKSKVKKDYITNKELAKAKEAKEACPVNAIKIDEDNT